LNRAANYRWAPPHAAVARALLHAPEDPLREAKEALFRPGRLTPFSQTDAGDSCPQGFSLRAGERQLL
jgi:hypothetical protein